MSSDGFIVDPVRQERSSRCDAVLTLASLEGRLPDRVDGRPRRTKKIPQELRKRFMEVLDDNGKSIMVYVDEDGKVRLDTEKVQEELDAAGEFRGMNDTWEVDIKEVMASDEVPVAVKKGKRKRGDEEDDDDDQFDADDEPEKEESVHSDDVVADDADAEEDFTPESEEEEEDEDFTEDEDEDEIEEELKDLQD